MIIWINGAFGSGKTQTACELHRRLKNSYVYDPENAGFFIRDNLPDSVRFDDFQDHPIWRSFNYEMLDYISLNYSGDIIVPMTVTNKDYYDEIIGKLSKKYDVKHFILYAEKEIILKRLASRLEGRNSWAAQQIDRCIAAFNGDIAGHKIYTDNLSICQTAEKVAREAGVALSRDERSGFRKFIDRTVTKIKHIR